MMKGFALETIFKMFLYIVVVLVVIGLILYFRQNIISTLRLCDYIPGGCKVEEECKTVTSSEDRVSESVLDKYCNLCWERTGAKDFKESCNCYVLSLRESFVPPFTYKKENCELTCDKQTASLIFAYNKYLKKILIEC